MKKLTATLALFMALLALSAMAEPRQVVVELYTSQGCSSCPPADELLAKLEGRKGVIPLALHVDYWDYIGWKDSFGDPRFTARQKAYARSAGRRMIYTPQMIIDGLDDVVGSKPMEVVDKIEAAQAVQTGVTLQLMRDGSALKISARAKGAVSGPMDIQLVRYNPEKTVRIGSGENAGKTIRYVNTVTQWHKIGTWDGRAPLALVSEIAGSEPVVVIIQEAGPKRIVAAARLR